MLSNGGIVAMHRGSTLSLLFLIVVITSFFPVAYAEDEVNFPNFPQQLAEATGIPLFGAQVLCSVIFMLMFLLPLNATRRGSGLLPNLMIGLGIMGFCVAIGWLPYWILLLICLVIAVIWSNKITGWIGRR